MLYLLVCLFLLSLSSILYYCYSIYAVIDFFSHPIEIDNNFHPPISILKPICGVDWELYDNLVSFCQQDYPEYQIIFSVRDSKDPSIEIIKKIIDRFPALDISLVVSDRTIGTNLKVSNLANAEVEAKYPILLISDSDIRVQSDYLKQIVQPMCDPEVGVVTCLYNSLVEGWVAAFEAIDISTQFHSRVLTARKLQGMKFALGSTIVIRKTVLEEIGGFLSIADYLADDFQLGSLPAQKGYKVVLSKYIVEHILANVTIHDFIQRQIRWAKVIRVERFWGYLGLIFTQGTTIGLLFWLATLGSRLGWFVLLVTWSMRLLMAWILGIRSLKDPVAKKFLWLVPLRDLVGFAIWCYSLVGDEIEWRGRKFKLVESGKIATLMFADKSKRIC